MFINDIGSFNHFAISLCNFVFGIILITYNSEVNYSFKIFFMFWNILSDIDESFSTLVDWLKFSLNASNLGDFLSLVGV